MSNELNALDPMPESLKLVSGNQVELEQLRARQFFKFLRIITHGALPVMRDGALFDMSADLDSNEFMTRLLTIVVLSVPDAEDEAIEFVQAMCKPVGLIEGRRLNKQDTERNNALWAQLDEELENPELDDLVTIIEAIVRREAADIQALGKRLQGMFSLAQKTGQLSPSPTSPAPTSSADSPAPSTSSRRSTGGRTKRSATSASPGSDSVSPPSGNVTTTASSSSANG